MPCTVIQRFLLSQIEAPITEPPRIDSPARWKCRLYLPSTPSLPRWRNSAYETEPVEALWYIVCPRTPSGSADSMTTLRVRLATSAR